MEKEITIKPDEALTSKIGESILKVMEEESAEPLEAITALVASVVDILYATGCYFGQDECKFAANVLTQAIEQIMEKSSNK